MEGLNEGARLFGEDVVVGVNRFASTEPSPLTADLDSAIQVVDPEAEAAAAKSVAAWRLSRDGDPVAAAEWQAALDQLRADVAGGVNLMPATLRCVRARVTTGEWAGALRETFGEYRAPTGVGGSVGLGGAALSGPAADELRRIPIEKPEAPLTADPGLATAAPQELKLEEGEQKAPEAGQTEPAPN